MFGSSDAGELLGPETVRRLACDASVVPVVLGSTGEIVDLGRRHRFFSSAQTRALWLRDGHCSFPGCSVPASWCDSHHLWHWADGGPTDLEHAALLCGRHHTVVHAKGFHGTVRSDHVEWDLTPGAYDSWLARRRARAADALAMSPPPAAGSHPGQVACASPRLFDEWGQVATAAGPAPAPPWRP